jgi:flagellar hook-length control protein FliK
MHAGALPTTAAPSVASGTTPEPGASLLDLGKGGAGGGVDAFTQALAALLGLPAQPLTQQVAATSVAAPVKTAQTIVVPAFAPVPPARANGEAAPTQGVLAPTLALPEGGPPVLNRLVLNPAAAPPTAAAARGFAPSLQPQPASLTSRADPPAAQPAAQRTASSAPAAGATLATVSVVGRIQSDIVAPPAGGMGGESTAAAPQASLTPPAPLATGASRLDLLPPPAQIVAPKPAPAAPQPKTAAKTETATTGTQSAAGAAAETGPQVEPAHAGANMADGQGQPPAGRSGGQTSAQGESTQPATTTTAVSNAAAATAVAPPATAGTQGATAAATIASPISAQLATHVVKAVDGKSTRFDIALEPAGLGRVDVRLRIDTQGQVSAQFSFASQHAAAEAKAQASQLQQALEQAGFTVGQGGLSFDVGGRGPGLASQESQPAPPPTSAAGPLALADALPDAAQPLTRRPVSGLDITI